MGRCLTLLVCLIVVAGNPVIAATYKIGPGQPLRHPGLVPWENLGPGDLVEIHWRAEPYRSKWVMSRQGTAQQPIIVRGIPGPKGELPILDASRASAPTGLSYWSHARGVIKIGASNNSGDAPPQHIVIENLDIRGARPGNFYLGPDGLSEYDKPASPIYLESGQHVTIRGCRLHDSGNGVFVAPDCEEILVEGCDIFDNGIEDSVYEHNAYSESKGIVYQFNRFGPLRTGCRGNNLKDRSAGLIVRYNRIEAGNRQLDLVDSQEGMEIRNDPRYHLAQVYGNLLIEYQGPDNNQIVHFGGDSGDDNANRRSLKFYHNTIVSTRAEKTVLLRLSTPMQNAEVWNNLIYTTAPGSTFAILDEEGQVQMRNCFLKPKWKKCHGELRGQIAATGLLEAEDPGFVTLLPGDLAHSDLHLGPRSPLRDAGVEIPTRTLSVEFEPPGLSSPAIVRTPSGKPDIGCFEVR
jgi:hypothetical protein